MYVDRKLAGLQAVQTLSRLNRTHSRYPNKRTFVLDFQNTTYDIREAFEPYFEMTELSDVTDLSQVHDLYYRLLKFPVIDKNEVQRFAETYFGGMPSEAGGPPRIEYELTEEGERTYIDLLRTALTSRDPRLDLLAAAVGLMDDLPRSEAIDLLRQRAQAMDEWRASIVAHLPANTDLDTWGPVGEVIRLWLHTAESRADWTRRLIRRLEEGAYRMADEE